MDEKTLVQILRASNKIKLEPLKQWKCDKCGAVIDDASNGWLEWLKVIKSEKEYKFRIVHHDETCMYDDRDMYKNGYLTRDMHLDHYLGPDGLNNLLEIILRPGVEQQEVAKIIRRLHIPFYEQSLLYRDEAYADGYFSSDPDYYCNVEDNLRLIENYSDNN
nr:hypothetical protein [Fredinandcohnia onubensis]